MSIHPKPDFALRLICSKLQRKRAFLKNKFTEQLEWMSWYSKLAWYSKIVDLRLQISNNTEAIMPHTLWIEWNSSSQAYILLLIYSWGRCGKDELAVFKSTETRRWWLLFLNKEITKKRVSLKKVTTKTFEKRMKYIPRKNERKQSFSAKWNARQKSLPYSLKSPWDTRALQALSYHIQESREKLPAISSSVHLLLTS